MLVMTKPFRTTPPLDESTPLACLGEWLRETKGARLTLEYSGGYFIAMACGFVARDATATDAIASVVMKHAEWAMWVAS
jgi:hypothetical protein